MAEGSRRSGEYARCADWVAVLGFGHGTCLIGLEFVEGFARWRGWEDDTGTGIGNWN